MFGRPVIYLTILAALVASILPMPEFFPWVEFARPDWLFLVLAYWTIALPHRVNVGTAWVSGMLLDVLTGVTLGNHALTLSVACYLLAINFQKVRNFSVWQQAFVIAMVTVLIKIMQFWVGQVVATSQLDLQLFIPAISNLVLWLWVFFLLRYLRRRFQIK